MPERLAQVEDPAAIPAPERYRAGAPVPRLEAEGTGDLARLAGAVAALARRVEAVERPRVTVADRSRALDQARAFVTELGRAVGVRERIEAEVTVARYLTGE